MSNFVKRFVPYETSGWIFAILALSVFPIRYVFTTSFNFQTGAYSDFTSISLYLSDILIFGFILFHFRSLLSTTWNRMFIPVLIWLFIEIIAHFKAFPVLQGYFTWRIVLLIALSLVISGSHGRWSRFLPNFVVIFGVIQSVIAILQFFLQKSLGLYHVGESHLSASTLGVAKIVAYGTTYIRGYGTFPHPNLLAAFLAVSIAFNLYLLTKKLHKSTNSILILGLITNIFGVFVTFSRGGIAAFGGILLGFLITLLLSKNYQDLIKIALASFAGILIAGGILAPFLLTRVTITDNAVKERYFYNQIGLKIIKDKPLLGTGPGMSVLHMEQYSGVKLLPWEVQPIHNFYIITFAEWGIGAIFFLLAILIPIILIFKKTLSELTTPSPNLLWHATLALIGLAILFLFLFDHYFYTIWPTQVMLWVIIGIICSTLNKKPLQNTETV